MIVVALGIAMVIATLTAATMRRAEAVLVTRLICFHNVSITILQYLQYADDSAMSAQRLKPITNAAEAGDISFGLGHFCRALGPCETCAARTLLSARGRQAAAALCCTHPAQRTWASSSGSA